MRLDFVPSPLEGLDMDLGGYLNDEGVHIVSQIGGQFLAHPLSQWIITEVVNILQRT